MSKINLFKIFLIISILSCSKSDSNEQDETTPQELLCSTDYSTADVLTNIDEEIYNGDESVNAYSIYSWSSNETNRILIGNGIPGTTLRLKK